MLTQSEDEQEDDDTTTANTFEFENNEMNPQQCIYCHYDVCIDCDNKD